MCSFVYSLKKLLAAELYLENIIRGDTHVTSNLRGGGKERGVRP